MEKILERWYRKVWITRGCRFNANDRYIKHASLSNVTLVLMNIYVLAINLFPLTPGLKDYFPAEDITIYTVILSVLMLSIGQLISSKDYTLKAMMFHDCGKRLSVIYDEIDLLKNASVNIELIDLRKIIKEYNQIIEMYETNHKSIDLQIFKSANIDQFSEIKKPVLFVKLAKINLFFQVSFKYWLCILIPPSVFVIYLYLVI
jgi:hypothetical protein